MNARARAEVVKVLSCTVSAKTMVRIQPPPIYIVCSTMALILRPKYKEWIPLWLLIFVFPILAYHNAGFIERENVSCLPNALCI